MIPMPYRAFRQSQFFNPRGKALSSSTISYVDVTSRIPQLLLLRCPPTIGGFVITIIVPSIDLMLHRRTGSHVGQKMLEPFRTFPTIAGSDSSTEMVLVVFGIPGTATNDSAPDVILGRSVTAVLESVLVAHVPFGGSLRSMTSARQGLLVSHRIVVDLFFVPAPAEINAVVPLAAITQASHPALRIVKALVEIRGGVRTRCRLWHGLLRIRREIQERLHWRLGSQATSGIREGSPEGRCAGPRVPGPGPPVDAQVANSHSP